MESLNAKPSGLWTASLRILAVAACIGSFSPAVYATDPAKPAMDLPQVVTEASAPSPVSALKDTTHPTINLSPDDTQLVKLDQDAGLVVVGNPEHANVIADSTRTLVVIPRRPGATYFTVMGNDGNIIMRRLVIVAGPEEHYVRVKNTCKAAGSSANCVENNIYYCPDTCHEVLLGTETASVTEQAVPSPADAKTAQAQQEALGGFFTNDEPEEDEDVEEATEKLQNAVESTAEALEKQAPQQ